MREGSQDRPPSPCPADARPGLLLIPSREVNAWTELGKRRQVGTPGEAGGYWFAPYERNSQGWLEVHYGKRKLGHYHWYYPGQGSTGVHIKTPVLWPDGTMKGKWYWATWKC
jgi:hypothetical protein